MSMENKIIDRKTDYQKTEERMAGTSGGRIKGPRAGAGTADRVDYGRVERQVRIKNRVGKTITYMLLTLWALVVLFPFYWMVLTSLKGYGAYNSEFIPRFYTLSPTLQNYVDAFTTVSLGRYLLNTAVLDRKSVV